MRTDELTPTHRSPALGRGPDVVSFQNIGHGLVAHFVPQITQRTHNPPISPSAILSGQLQDQFFDLIARRAAFAAWPILRAVEFFGDPPAVPPKNRFRSHDLRHLFQRFASQSFGGQSQADAFGISEPNSPLNLVAQNSVFGHQILISGQQLLVNGSRDVSKHSLPVHRLKLNQSTRVQTTFRPPVVNACGWIRSAGLTIRDRAVLDFQAQVRGQPSKEELVVLGGKPPNHGGGQSILTAVAVPSQYYLGSAMVAKKTNEIPVARKLFQKLDLEGRFVSLDALHTQTETALDLVQEHGAHYTLTVKDNQPGVHETIKKLLPKIPAAFPP